MQATAQPPHRAPNGAPAHHERHRPTQTTLHRLVQQHAASSFAQAAASKNGRVADTVRTSGVTQDEVLGMIIADRQPQA